MAEGGFEIDARGLYKKIKAFASMEKFFTSIHLDAASWLQQKELNEVLNGQYVNRISGNLRRSQEVVPISEVLSVIATDLGIAPYALAVHSRPNKDFLRITVELFGAEMQRIIRAEFDRMVSLVNSGEPYKYANPFPDA